MAQAVITTKLKGDSASLKAELNSAMRSVNELKDSVAAFAPIAAEAFSVAGLAMLAKEATATAVEVAHAAETFGLSTTKIQELKHAAEQSGVSFESVETAMGKLEQNAAKAAEGNTKLRATFARLNIDADTFVNLPIDEKLMVLADAFDNAKDRNLAFNDVIEAAGKGARAIIPLLEKGSQKIQELMSQAHPMTAQSIAELKRFSEESADTWELVKKFAGEAFSSLLVFVKMITAPFKALGALIGGVFAHFVDGVSWKDAIKGAGEEIDKIMDNINEKAEKPKKALVEPDDDKDERTKKEIAEVKRIDERIKKLHEETEALKTRNEEAGKPIKQQIADVGNRMDDLEKKNSHLALQNRIDPNLLSKDEQLQLAEFEKKRQELIKEREALEKKLNDETKRYAEEQAHRDTELHDLQFQNALKKLNPEQKVIALKQEQAKLIAEAAALEKQAIEEKDKDLEASNAKKKKADEDRLKAAKLAGEIDTIKKEESKKDHEQKIFTDDIRRAGGVNASTRAIVSAPDHTIALTQATKDLTKSTVDNTEAVKANTRQMQQPNQGASFG